VPPSLPILVDAAAPFSLALSPASDGGSKGDNITNVATPFITGMGEAGDRLTLFDGSAVVGTATIGPVGNWSVMTTTLAAGSHTLTARETHPREI
jgi:large repetitive protein